MLSRPSASVLSTSRIAAALLLTTIASSAPVSSREQVAHDVVALAASTRFEIEFERGWRTHRRDGSGDTRLRDDRAAEIGVQHGAGEVEDAAQLRRILRFERHRRAGRDGSRGVSAISRRCRNNRATRGSEIIEGGAHGTESRRATETRDDHAPCIAAQDLINGWNRNG